MMTASAMAADPGPFPTPVFPDANQPSAAKALLGKELFWDVNVSSNNTIACGSCHVPELGGSSVPVLNPGADKVFGTSDDVFGSPGINGQSTGRKAPTAIGAYIPGRLFWDGRAGVDFHDPNNPAILVAKGDALADQGTKPELGDLEMAFLNRSWGMVETKLAGLSGPETGMPYPTLFSDAFGDPTITAARVGLAIADYERTLVPDQSPVALWGAGGTPPSAQVEAGFDVFRGPGRCNKCHDPRNGFTDGLFHNIGVTPISDDAGRFNVTGRKKDLGAFKTATLANVGIQERYFHGGRFDTLAQVVDFYDRGGDFHVNQDPLIRPLGLDAGEKADLIAFLEALTDPRAENGLAPFDHVNVTVVVADPVDVTDPSVALASPSLANPLNGNVKFKINASDDQNVKRVTLQIDAGTVLQDLAPPYEFIVNTNALTNAPHTLNITSEDFAAHVASDSLPFSVANPGVDTLAPEVMIVTPNQKLAVGNPAGGNVPVTVAVFDNIGVTRVDYMVDGTPINPGLVAPFGTTFDSRSFTNGQHTLKAIAKDAANNMSAQASQLFTIDNLLTFPVTTLPFAADGVAGALGEFTLTGTFRNGSQSFRFVGLGLPQPVNGTTLRVVMTSPLGDFALGTVRPSAATGNVTATLRATGNTLKRGFAAEEVLLFDGPTQVGQGLVAIDMLIDGAATVSTRINGVSRSVATLMEIVSTGPGEVFVTAAATSTRAFPLGNYTLRFETTTGNIDFGPFQPDPLELNLLAFETTFEDPTFLQTSGTFQRVRILFNGVSVGFRTISVR
jgi:cytochrome c peroxidase